MTETNEPSLGSSLHTAQELDRVTRHDMATVALRLLGIYLAIRGMDFVPMLYSYISTGRIHDVAVFYLLFNGGLYLAAGILLLIFAPHWGQSLLPRGDPTQPRPTGSDLQDLAFSVVGILLAAQALGGITTVAVGGTASWQIYGHEGMLAYLGPALQLAIGIALFLGGRGLSRFWRKLRTTSYGKNL